MFTFDYQFFPVSVYIFLIVYYIFWFSILKNKFSICFWTCFYSSSRYDNHSPPSTTGANGNAANSSGCQDGDHLTPGRNSNGGSDGRGSSPNEANLDDKDERDSNDVRIKCESTTNSFAFEVFCFCFYYFFCFIFFVL